MPLDLGQIQQKPKLNNMLRYVPRSLDKISVDLRLRTNIPATSVENTTKVVNAALGQARSSLSRYFALAKYEILAEGLRVRSGNTMI
jgi:hypothetical protein